MTAPREQAGAALPAATLAWHRNSLVFQAHRLRHERERWARRAEANRLFGGLDTAMIAMDRAADALEAAAKDLAGHSASSDHAERSEDAGVGLGSAPAQSAELLAARLEIARLRDAAAIAERALLRLTYPATFSPEPGSLHEACNVLGVTLAAPPPALEELRELVAAVKVEIDEWIESGDGEGGPGYPPERLGAAYAAVLAAYPYLGRA